MNYLDENLITACRQTETPRNYSATGYGNKIPTSWQVRVNKRWHRIYVICYSNSGTAYVLVKGKPQYFCSSWHPSDHHIASNVPSF